MKTALHTWSFRNHFQNDPNFTLFKALDITAEMGFRSVEIMAGKAGSPPGDFAADDIAYLQSVARHAAALDIEILALATYNDFAYVKDEAWRLANIEYIKKWLRLAGEMGVLNIRMLTGYSIEGERRERLEQLTIDGIRACVPVAEAAGVNMALENHNSIFFSADEILWLLNEIGSPRLTTCPDPTNWSKNFFASAAPEEREMVFEGAAKIAPYATQSHIKIKGVQDDKLQGYGDDLERLLRIYHNANYNGAIAFESIADGDLLAPLPQARQIVEDAITRVEKSACAT